MSNSNDRTISNARLHGLLPLIRDDQSQTGLRFGIPGADDESDFIHLVSELPDIDLSIRIFGNAGEMRGWQAAAREFTGNAIAFANAPEALGQSFCLVARFDSQPDHAETLERRIPALDGLTGQPVDFSAIEKVAPSLDASVGKHLRDAEDRRQRQATQDFWSGEVAAMSGTPVYSRLGHFDRNVENLEFEVSNKSVFDRWTGKIKKDEAGALITLNPLYRIAFDPDLEDEWRKLAGELGWESTGNGLIRRVAQVRSGEVSMIAETVGALETPLTSLKQRQTARQHVAKVIADKDLVRALQRTKIGCPVVTGQNGEPAAQWNPRTGKVGVVAGTRVHSAIKSGVIEPVWWADRWKTQPATTVNAMANVVFALTKTGASIAAGDLEAASRSITDDMERGAKWIGYRTGDASWAPVADGASINRHVSDESVAATGEAVDRVLASIRFPSRIDRSDYLAFAAACVATGRAEAAEGAIHPVQSSSPRP